MTSTEIERRTSELAILPGQTRFTEVQVAALRHLGLQGDDADDENLQFSDADLGVFFHQCARTGLDPFARQIYMIMRKEFGRPKPTIQTGIDGFRKIGRDAAIRQRVTVSKQAPVWFDDDGNEFKVWNRAEPPAAAMVNIIVAGIDTIAVCNYREYVQRKRDGKPNSMWTKMPANMLAKCAEAAAWRMAFPSDFSGIVGTDEPLHTIIDEDGAPAGGPQRQSHTTGRGVAGLEQALSASDSGAKPEPAQVVEGQVVEDTPQPEAPAANADNAIPEGEAITKAQYQAVIAGLDKLFGEVIEGRASYVHTAVKRNVASLRDLTGDEAEKLLGVIAEHLAERAQDDAREREEADKKFQG